MAIIPLRTAMKRVVGKVYVDNIAIEADAPESIERVISDVQRLMRRRHHLPDYKDDDFTLRNSQRNIFKDGPLTVTQRDIV